MVSGNIEKMNRTIQYYNTHAEEYFEKTSRVDMTEAYSRFLKYVPVGSRIMDLGCGSGRDVARFRDHGYDAYGLDASEEMVRLAQKKLGIPVEVGNIETWMADEPFNGIWCCASLLHLSDEQLMQFFTHLNNNLADQGAVFISVKQGIETGGDELDRYQVNFTEDKISDLCRCCDGLAIEELWYSEDELKRQSFKWLNAILKRHCL